MTKILYFLFSIFSFSIAAQAQQYSRPRPAPVVQESTKPTDFSTSKFFVSGIYSTASEVKYKGQVVLFGENESFTATEKTTGALGFTGGYIKRKSFGLGYSGELTYELPRPSNGLSGKAGDIVVKGTYDKAPSNSMLTLGGNLNFSFGQRIYIFGGLNYPFAFASNKGMSLTGLPGFQTGGGFVFSDILSAELSYRMLRLKGTIEAPPLEPLQIDQATFSGFILSVFYLF